MPARSGALAQLCFILAVLPSWSAGAPIPEERAIESIRRTAAQSPSGPEGWPLPLAASWNVGDRALGFGPAWQVAEIQRGEYLLPWFGLSIPPPPTGKGALTGYPDTVDTPYYYQSAIHYLAEQHLPLSFESIQWEWLLAEVSADYARKTRDGVHLLPLSPFDPVEPWYAVGRAWARHPTLQRLQQLYPDPPLVLFISNNEQMKMTADELHAGVTPGAGPEVMARRRTIGDAWIERYRAMERGFRDGLEAPAWRAHAQFIGYDAFVMSAMGRWGGWPAYSLYVPGRTEPWPYAWDGASPSFYVHDWAPDSDYTVWSPQIEAMNLVSGLEEVRRRQREFWFELSVWDGQQPGQPTDKRMFYQQRGQELTPLRYGGMVQFGMWLLRPRVVREFRNPQDDRIRFGAYFDALLAAVARVHEDETLRGFWRSGRLLENPLGGHPYQDSLPAELAGRARWFLLDCDANPPRPWQLTTPLRVYALALEQGGKPHREWLVYAFSPLDTTISAEVTIPDGPGVRVSATRAGYFTLITEGDGAVRPVGVTGH